MAEQNEIAYGIMSVSGQPGPKGDKGEGVPAGGTTGQYLKKKTDADYDTEWSSSTSGVSTFNGRDGDVEPAINDYSLSMVGGVPLTNSEIDEMWNSL